MRKLASVALLEAVFALELVFMFKSVDSFSCSLLRNVTQNDSCDADFLDLSSSFALQKYWFMMVFISLVILRTGLSC